MTKLKVANALGVIRGIIESDYDLNCSRNERKANLLRSNLDYLQGILVEEPRIAGASGQSLITGEDGAFWGKPKEGALSVDPLKSMGEE